MYSFLFVANCLFKGLEHLPKFLLFSMKYLGDQGPIHIPSKMKERKMTYSKIDFCFRSV